MKFTDVAGIMNIPYVAEKVKLSHVAEIVKLSHVAGILEAGSMYDHHTWAWSFKQNSWWIDPWFLKALNEMFCPVFVAVLPT